MSREHNRLNNKQRTSKRQTETSVTTWSPNYFLCPCLRHYVEQCDTRGMNHRF